MWSLPRCHEAATGEAAVSGDISPRRCLCKGPFPLAGSYNTDAPEELNIRTKYSKKYIEMKGTSVTMRLADTALCAGQTAKPCYVVMCPVK